MRPQQGVTILELMITVAIAAIILTFAMPVYNDILQKRRVTSAAERLAGLMANAQSESVKWNRQLTVSYTRNSATDWCIGMSLDTAANACDCEETNVADADYCGITDASANLVSHIFNNDDTEFVNLASATDGSSDSKFTFDPVRGVMATLTDVARFNFLTDDATYALRVEVNPTGRVIICNPINSIKVPGYQSC